MMEKGIWQEIRSCNNDLSDTRVSCYLTPGCQHVQHPGVGMYETRVSYNLILLSGIDAKLCCFSSV